MLFALRVTLPDRPGMLAQVACSLADLGADVVTLDVVHREEGIATDHICVEAADGLAEALRRVIENVPGVLVEAIRPVKDPPDPAAALELGARLATGGEDPLTTLVQDLPGALLATWCMAVASEAARPRVLAASPAAPTRARFELPWLPLDGPCRLDAAAWMPSPWRMSAGLGTLQLAAAPLWDAHSAVLLARAWGARFRREEVRQLGLLARIASARGSATASGVSGISTIAGAGRR